MDQIYSFISTNIPSPQNGGDSVAGGCVMVALILSLILWLERKYRKVVKGEPRVADPNLPYKRVIIWENVCILGTGFLSGVYGLYLICAGQSCWKTTLEAVILHLLGGFSISGGCHRLYSHRAFKASKLFEVIVIILNCIALQNPIINWVRDHRCHHKYVDTNADPYTASRGLFFSQIGWLLVERHPDVVTKGRKLDISDVTSNPLLRFQQKYYVPMILLFNVTIPVLIPQLLWGETFWRAIFICGALSHMITLQSSGMINSLAHWKGEKPYNRSTSPVDLPKYLFLLQECAHNFHHAFPFDYYGCEHSWIFNFSGNIVKLCSKIGLTYDLKLASPALIARVKQSNASKHQGEGEY